MIKVAVRDWFGNTYLVKLNSVPSVGEDFQVGWKGDKHVRGIVSRVERTVTREGDFIEVYLNDDRNELNDESDFRSVDWW